MTRRVVIGHMSDGTPLTLDILTVAEYLRAHRVVVPAFVHHEPNVQDVTTVALEERYAELLEFYEGRSPLSDPRCGCEADNEGGRCYWDDLDQIDDELGRRGR